MNNKFNRRNFLGTASLTTGAFALSSFTGDSKYDLEEEQNTQMNEIQKRYDLIFTNSH
jgi:hypothetical protein